MFCSPPRVSQFATPLSSASTLFAKASRGLEYPRTEATSLPTNHGSLLTSTVRISPNSGFLKICSSFKISPFFQNSLPSSAPGGCSRWTPCKGCFGLVEFSISFDDERAPSIFHIAGNGNITAKRTIFQASYGSEEDPFQDDL